MNTNRYFLFSDIYRDIFVYDLCVELYADAMMREVKYAWLFIVMIYTLQSCDTKEKRSHQNFEDLLAVTATYVAEIDKLEKKAGECVDIAEAYKYATMAKNLKKEGNEEIERMFGMLPKPVIIPVEQTNFMQFFSMSGLEITSADLFALSVHARVNLINPDVNRFIEIFLCGTGENGTELPPVFSLNGMVIPENQEELLLSGQILNPEKLTGLVNFKLVNIHAFETKIIPGAE